MAVRSTRFFILLLSLLCPVVGCSEGASNTPEEAFGTVKTALQKKDWALLYGILPPSLQEAYEKQLNEFDPAALERELRVSSQEWSRMTTPERFARVFTETDLRLKLAINPDQWAISEVKSSTTRGDAATLLIDDGKGHREKIGFILVDGAWRFDLEGRG